MGGPARPLPAQLPPRRPAWSSRCLHYLSAALHAHLVARLRPA